MYRRDMHTSRKDTGSCLDGEKVMCMVKSVHKEGVAVSVMLGGQVVNGTISTRCYGVGEARARAREAIRLGDVIEAVVRSYDANTRSCSLVLPGAEDLPRLPRKARPQGFAVALDSPRGMASATVGGRKSNRASVSARWRRIQTFLQEAAMVIDYLHWRTLGKQNLEQPEDPLFALTADQDGDLTEDAVVGQLEAIARQARAGFVDGDEFPLFGSLDGRVSLCRMGRGREKAATRSAPSA